MLLTTYHFQEEHSDVPVPVPNPDQDKKDHPEDYSDESWNQEDIDKFLKSDKGKEQDSGQDDLGWDKDTPKPKDQKG